MLTIPNTFVYCPCDLQELSLMFPKILQESGVCFLRMMRDALPWVWTDAKKFSPSFIEKIYESCSNIVDVTIFSTGSMSCFTPKIAKLLEENALTVRVVHLGRIKPIDGKNLIEFIDQTNAVITLEEHNIICGFGAMLCRIISEINPKPTLVVGIQDRFGQSGKVEELYQEYGLTPEQITQQILDFVPIKIERKKKSSKSEV
jgi:transketolase